MILTGVARFLAFVQHEVGSFGTFSIGSPLWALFIVIDALETYKMCNMRNKSNGPNLGGGLVGGGLHRKVFFPK